MNELIISPQITLKSALKKLDQTSKKVLLVADSSNKLMGTLSDGDVRRALLAEVQLTSTIEGLYNLSPTFVIEDKQDAFDFKKTFSEKKIELIPIVDKNLTIVGTVSWDDVLSESDIPLARKQSLNATPVVIMAGGKGSRLAPFTDVLPKPLIPVKGRSILETIISEFLNFGATKYFLTLNYRGKMIEAYLNSIEKDYETHNLWETDFYGTAGSLKLLPPELIENNFIVSNCDIIVKAKYDDVLDFHNHNNASITVLSSIQHHKIPYGVIEYTSGGKITKLKEKPEFSFPINTGVYILNKECLNYIPENQFFNMTDLIDLLISENKNVFTYLVNENDYIDIGQWSEYKKNVERLGEIT